MPRGVYAHTLRPLSDFYIPEPMSGCWIWIGGRNAYGYGAIRGGQQAHRLVYEAERGPIPKGLALDHLCRIRCCVNPAHLEPVTRGDNVLRGVHPTVIAWRTNTCLRGHALVPGNIYKNSGHRACRLCVRTRQRNDRLAKKATA